MRTILLAWLCVAAPLLAQADGLAPFVAEYEVRYGSMAVGSSRTELGHGTVPGHWFIETRSNASGFARLITSGTLVQRSDFELTGAEIRPLRYRFDDGSRRAAEDVMLDFDWSAGRVRGSAEGDPVDLAIEAGLQDAASIQALVQARVASGAEPGDVAMIEKDFVKYYRYERVSAQPLRTALGELDTILYRSTRIGRERETLLWLAPALGWVTVQAEQRRNGKRTFQTRIRSYLPGA
ncbi:MAG: DUF3108 domain-containing protein [Gammaproteobacteria bacterium]|nr:DUF3108 domain-containing protein [Gammaproteobacteria bacterium]